MSLPLADDEVGDSTGDAGVDAGGDKMLEMEHFVELPLFFVIPPALLRWYFVNRWFSYKSERANDRLHGPHINGLTGRWFAACRSK